MFCFIFLAMFLFMPTQQYQSDTAAVSSQAKPDHSVILISVEGTISPTTTNYINRGIKIAAEEGAECLVVQLDTPGGLLQSTKQIVQSFLKSDGVPVVVYVSPAGASAASAGTFITMAADIAAMAPTTTIGAASPVSGGQIDTVMQKKLFNYTESFLKSIANRRNRNADWAIDAVRNAESITAERALEINVIDLIAASREALLDKIDGRVINGDTLHTNKAVVKEIPNNLAENFLSFIMRPEVMLILMMIALYGIVGEITNPGAIVPGVAGVIALILVLYASAAMPINVAGFILIAFAVVLFIAEAFTPAFGLLIAGGAAAFLLGLLMLFQDLPEMMEPSWGWLLPATVLTTLFFFWIATEGIKIQFTKSITGKESMIGRRAEVTDTITGGHGRIFINGEYWNAVSNDEIQKGEDCKVEAIEGLTVRVRRIG